MALNAATTWEVQNGGSDTNGGGYVGTGTDYSQQAAAQLTLTDLACASGTAVVTSVTGGFTTAMIGNLVQIASGTNFTPGFYEITARTSTNQITLDRDPTTGSAATGGNVKVGGALASPGKALSGMVAGNDLFIKYSATPYDITSTTENIASGRLQFNSSVCGVSADNLMRVTGYQATRTHENTDLLRPTIRAGAALGACDLIELHSGGSGWVALNNFIVDGNQRAVDCFEGNMQRIRYRRVRCGNTTGKGFAGNGANCIYVGCDVEDADTEYVFRIPAGSFAYACVAYNCPATAFSLGLAAVAVGCQAISITGSSSDGFSVTADFSMLINCTAVTIGRAGFLIGSGTDGMTTLVNCLVYNCGVSSGSARAYWDAAGAPQVLLLNCAWGGSGAAFASSHFVQCGSVTLSASPFVSLTGLNFNLNGASGGGLALRQVGFPSDGFPADLNMAIGAIQFADPLSWVHLLAPA